MKVDPAFLRIDGSIHASSSSSALAAHLRFGLTAADDVWELLLQQSCCITQHINTVKLHKPTGTGSEGVLDGWMRTHRDGEERAERSGEE